MTVRRVRCAAALHAAGQYDEAARLFADAERRQKEHTPSPLLSGLQGYLHSDLLISEGDYASARDRASKTIVIARQKNWLLHIGLDTLAVGRAHLGLALAAKTGSGSDSDRCDDTTHRSRAVRRGR
jgi:hypothetical protein